MMKNCCRYLTILGLFLFSILAVSRNASADTVIADSANTLTTDEIQELQNYCDTILKLHDTSVYIVTSKKIGADDDYKDYMNQIKNNSDTPENMVLLFVSTKDKTPFCQILGNGKAKTYMTQDRCDTIIKRMQGNLTDKDYYSAFKTFCQESQRYMSKTPKFDNFFFHPVPQLIFSLFLSIMIIFFMARNTAGKTTADNHLRLNCQNPKLLGRIDHFSHTTVSRVKQ